MLQVPSAGAGGSALEVGSTTTFTVPSAVAVGDLLYLTGADTADRADNTNAATMPAVALCVDKPTTTTAEAIYLGEAALFSGLTPGAPQFVGLLGALTETPPVGPNILQEVGEAINATTLLFHPKQVGGGGGGETNTAANVGGGAAIFRDKVGVVINLRTLTGLGGVTAAVNGDVVEIDGSGAAGSPWVKDEFTPASDGQVTFILSTAPTDLASFELTVNGIEYDDVTDYTVSGTTVTWLNVAFTLKTKDKLIIQYK